MTNKPEQLLEYKVDSYNGILVDPKALLDLDELHFARALQQSLSRWHKDGRKGIWLRIPIKKSSFVPIATELGFAFHDCSPEFLVLTKWLANTSNKLPLPPTHHVGVGGFVVNENREVLVIREKSGPATAIWKIPGGMSDPGEYVHEAAIREVAEETGIQTQFIGVLSIRQHHTAQFNKSDLYWTCLLKPLTNKIVIQEDEIAEAKWMPLDEFLGLPYYRGLYKNILEIGRHAADGKYEPWAQHELPVGFTNGTNFLYHGCTAKF